MKKIKLSCNRGHALVDEEDFKYLSQYKWRLSRSGYAWTGHHPIIIMHRLLMKAPLGKVVDHKNHNKLDNRKENLRLCSQRENLWNSAHRKTNKSGYTGVNWDKYKNRWRVTCNSKDFGYFKNIDAAVKKRAFVAAKLHGDFLEKAV